MHVMGIGVVVAAFQAVAMSSVLAENYEVSFMELVEGRNWEVKKLLFDTELVFIVKK